MSATNNTAVSRKKASMDLWIIFIFTFLVLGMAFVAVAWGFFEGFNYVIIADKINICMPSKLWWLDWGAIICAVMCILVHSSIGITPKGIIEMCTTLIAIYGMLMARKYTGNTWGCSIY